MKTEQFNISLFRDGEQQVFQVEIKSLGSSTSICANIYGKEVHFSPDEHKSLCAAPGCDLDKELLYQVGRAIRSQRPAFSAQ